MKSNETKECLFEKQRIFYKHEHYSFNYNNISKTKMKIKDNIKELKIEEENINQKKKTEEEMYIINPNQFSNQLNTSEKNEYIKKIRTKHIKHFKERANILLLIILTLLKLSVSDTEYLYEDIDNYTYMNFTVKEGFNKFINNGEKDNLKNHNGYTRPDEIRINGIIYDFKNASNYTFNFTEPINTVYLIWKKEMKHCCYNMFRNCHNIMEMNLSHFFPAGITDLANFFWDCFSLSKIDFSNFDTTHISSSGNMFHNCISLTSLNLSFFHIPTLYIDSMFSNCTSLRIIDFPSFNILDSMLNIANIFINCTSLEYLNIGSFEPNNSLLTNFFDLFLSGDQKNLVICTDNTEMISNNPDSKCYTISCGKNWQNEKKRINTENDNCTDSCELTDYKYEYNFECVPSCFSGTYDDNYICRDCHPNCKECDGPDNSDCIICADDKYIYLGKCVSDCSRGYYNDIKNQVKTCKCELLNCYSCNLESFNKGLCLECEEGYYPIYNINNDYSFKNCSKLLLGYYLDKDEMVYKQCYSSCKNCEIGGDDKDHNCIECKPDYNIEIDFGLYKNCYGICPYYYYFNQINGIAYYTISQNCPEDYDKLIVEKNECISSCSDHSKYKYEFKKNVMKNVH